MGRLEEDDRAPSALDASRTTPFGLLTLMGGKPRKRKVSVGKPGRGKCGQRGAWSGYGFHPDARLDGRGE